MALEYFLNGAQVTSIFIGKSFLGALIYTLLYTIVFSLSPWVLSIGWLGLSLLLFSANWLRWYWAIPVTGSLMIAFYLTLHSDKSIAVINPLNEKFAWGVILILCWVSLSGAGGRGFQTLDYVMHNGRLEDLVQYSWPVFYQSGKILDYPEWSDKNVLVIYAGYYLPAALVGKLFNVAVAFEFMHYWTLTGCWLALRWLLHHTSVKSTVIVAAVLILFGGWDIVGWFLHGFYSLHKNSISLDTVNFRELCSPSPFPGWLDFWAGDVVDANYFFGNFVSLSVSLFWAPHQSIAGWLVIALLLQALQQENWRHTGVVYAMLVLWSPMALMGLALLPLSMFFLSMKLGDKGKMLTQWFSMPNVLAGLFVVIVGIYYASGSALSNPAGWLVLNHGWFSLPGLLFFHLMCWGIYALAVYPALSGFATTTKHFFIVLCITLFVLPWVHYGTYNDLMIRSSAALLFGLAIFVLKAIMYYHDNGKKLQVALLVVVLLPGTGSGLFNLANAFINHETKATSESVVNYNFGWEFLGSKDSAFTRYFSAPSLETTKENTKSNGQAPMEFQR